VVEVAMWRRRFFEVGLNFEEAQEMVTNEERRERNP